MKKRFWNAKYLAILLILVLPIGAITFIGIKLTPPRDEAPFLKSFHENRRTFDQMLAMFQADTDANTNIAFFANRKPQPWYSDADKLPARRLDEYTVLMSRAGVESAFRHVQDIGFSLSSWGGLDRGWNLSAVWRQIPPAVLATDWNGMRRSRERLSYLHIDGNWYFCLMRD